MRPSPSWALLAAAALVACGPVQKQDAARRVATAARRTDERIGMLALSSRGVSGVPAAPPQLKALAGAAPVPVGLEVELDPAAHRAALLAPRGLADVPRADPALVLFDGSTVYVRVRDVDQVGARPWSSLDLRHLGAVVEATGDQLEQPRALGDLAVLNPETLEEEALGLLTGSVHVHAAVQLSAPLSGVTEDVTSYSGNASLDKVARQEHRDPETNRTTEELLRAFAAHDDINPMTVAVDSAGNLDAMTVGFAGRPVKDVKFVVTFALALEPPGAAVDAAAFVPPSPADVVQLSSLDQLRGELDAWAPPAPAIP